VANAGQPSSPEALQAKWAAQESRVRAPCHGPKDFEWRRVGVVVSLGSLRVLLASTTRENKCTTSTAHAESWF